MKSLHDAMLDPDLFGRTFAGPSFDNWRAVSRMLDGQPLDEAQSMLYRQITGREQAPTAAFSEAYLIKPRRAGGTLFAAVLGLHAALQDYRALLGPGEVATVAMIASDRKQARQLMNYIKGLIADSPIIAAEATNQTQETISFAHRVNLEVHTTSFRSTRGYSYACVILDELAFFRDDLSANPDIELVRAVRPGLANLGGRLLGLSSPHSRRGHLYTMYRDHYGKPSDILVISAGHAQLNPTIDQRVIDRAMAEDPEAARAEWYGQFRGDVSQYLSDELIDAALPGRLKRGQHLAMMAFVDMSGGLHDASVLAVAHSEIIPDSRMPIVVLDHLEYVPAPHEPDAVVERFAGTLARLGLGRVVGDRYAASWTVNAFHARGIAYEPSELAKDQIYTEVLPLFAERRVELIEDKRLITELRLLERRPRSGGRSDSIDHPANAHDDCANAAAGALWLAMRQSQSADRPDSYIRASALLVPASAEGASRAPIELPPYVAGVFAAAAAGTGADVDTVGTLFFAFHDHTTAETPSPMLLLLDWDLRQISSGALEVWLPWTLERLKQLQASFRICRSNLGIHMEPSGSGEVICAQAWRSGIEEVHLCDNERLLATDFAQRAAGAGGHANLGDVRIARCAYEKTATVKGVAVNHLLRQLAFGINQPAREAGALLIAFSNGTLHAFGDFEQ